MQKVITINLNGRAYQVEEGGYAALVAYLQSAERQLKDNPDRAEIIADLEQAIAEKCLRFLGPQKTVVTAAEVDQIIKEMGPVDGTAGADGGATGANADAGTAGHAPKRLYLIKEGAMIAGVCSGIAAYLNIDPTIVRLVFIGLTLATTGAFIIVYFILAVVIPAATTSEERAAAHGEPFNAQELIERAKKHAAELKLGHDWSGGWRRTKRRWRREWRQTRRDERWGFMAAAVPPVAAGYATRVLAGVMVPVLSLASAAFFWLSAYAAVSLITSRAAYGVELPDDVPLWVGLLILAFFYNSVAWPIHAARRSSYLALGGPHHAEVAALDGLFSLAFGIVVVWFAYHQVPEVREFLRTLPDVWRSIQQS
jgi:phage shock protein PspC (stress-responsive transcriptional regulator)